MFLTILKRIFLNIITLLIIIVVSYKVMQWAPGNPYEGERSMSPEVMKSLKQKYDFTLTEYLSGIILEGDFRYSYQHRDLKVTEILAHAIPNSMELGFWSILVSVIFGLLWGTAASILRSKFWGNFILLFAMIGIAIPNFVVGPMLQLVFSLKLGLTPVAGWSDPASKILPIITLSLMYIAYISRICRGSILESVTKDFVTTAKAKGLSNIQIYTRHIFRNSMVPVINFLGPAAAALLTGTLVVEKIFNIPGMGRHFVESALQRDYPVALGVLIMYSAILLFFNLMTDILQTIVDPRIKLH